MDIISSEDINQIQNEVLSFYEQNKRDLPWRKTTDPFRILLSEFMLQQTQVNRVVNYYNKWIERWPTLLDLSIASFQDILSEWIGLGYNRRAKYLHESSIILVDNYNGDVLTAMYDYQNLPGIGKYTARAVRIFAGNENIATVDTNIRRILIHLFHLSTTISDRMLFDIADRCVPKGKSCIWHNALMDYGALYLTSRKTGIKSKTIQSTFKGSDRQIRGQIIRLLLKEPCEYKELKSYLHIRSERLDSILMKMMQDQMISKKETYYQVKGR